MTKRSVIQTNSLVRRLLRLLRQRELLQKKLKEFEKPIKEAIKELDVQIKPLKKELREHIFAKWDELFTGPLQSFVTYYASFGWQRVATDLEVVDQMKAIGIAREQGIFGDVGVVIIAPDRLQKFLVDHPEFTELFGDSIVPAGEYKSVSFKPNAKFHTRFDATRLTNRSYNLKD